jgi:hypothetical protein
MRTEQEKTRLSDTFKSEYERQTIKDTFWIGDLTFSHFGQTNRDTANSLRDYCLDSSPKFREFTNAVLGFALYRQFSQDIVNNEQTETIALNPYFWPFFVMSATDERMENDYQLFNKDFQRGDFTHIECRIFGALYAFIQAESFLGAASSQVQSEDSSQMSFRDASNDWLAAAHQIEAGAYREVLGLDGKELLAAMVRSASASKAATSKQLLDEEKVDAFLLGKNFNTKGDRNLAIAEEFKCDLRTVERFLRP